MQEQLLYEYAVIRLVPLVEREEFLNVGIILFCKHSKYIGVKFHLDEAKIKVFAKDIDLDQVYQNLSAFEKIALGDKTCGAIAAMDVPSRFRWLTAVRSTIIQCSKPHAGLGSDMLYVAERLFNELVL